VGVNLDKSGDTNLVTTQTTKRQITTYAGAPSTSFFSGPFGDYLSQNGPGTDLTEQHFTAKERDTESGLDYFPARYFNSNLGRFIADTPFM
jgi:RHS repeat-associated protein